MISIICDACLARFDVADDAAGTTVYCPTCGAKNGVPGGTNPTASVLRSAAGNTSDAETVLLRVHPAMFQARPATFSGLLVLALGGLGMGIYLLVSHHPSWGVACLVVSLLGGVPLGFWRVINMGTSLEITNKRTVAYRGLFSKASTEVRHNDIKNFQIDQTFLNRLLRVGTVGISSSAQHEVEIFVKDLPNPYRIREIIDQHRRL